LSPANRYTCLVCGRKFPEGQGVTLEVGSRKYAFHSKTCALKFLKKALENIEINTLINTFDKTAKEFEEVLKSKSELKSKKIG